MMLPYYTFSKRGSSGGGKHRYFRIPYVIHIQTNDASNGYPEVCITGIKPQKDSTELFFVGKTFNPYRDIAFGGTLLGFGGRNYWFSDEYIVGRLLKLTVSKKLTHR